MIVERITYEHKCSLEMEVFMPLLEAKSKILENIMLY